MKFESKCEVFLSRKCTQICCMPNVRHFRPLCVNDNIVECNRWDFLLISSLHQSVISKHVTNYNVQSMLLDISRTNHRSLCTWINVMRMGHPFWIRGVQYPNTCYIRNVLWELCQYHGSWCPGDFCRQAINCLDIDHVWWIYILGQYILSIPKDITLVVPCKSTAFNNFCNYIAY